MVRVRSSVEVTACRVVSNLAWCMIFREISILRHCFDVVSLGKALNPHMLYLTHVIMSTW